MRIFGNPAPWAAGLVAVALAAAALVPSPGMDTAAGDPSPLPSQGPTPVMTPASPASAASVQYVPLEAGAPADAAGVVAACAPEPEGEPREECYVSRLADLLRAEGSAKAIAQLESLVVLEPKAYGASHHIAHELGRISYGFYRDAPIALAACSMGFAAGCPHGVLEAYFQGGGGDGPEDLKRLCQATSAVFARSQCLHGLGHGLVQVNGHDLFAGLEACSLLSDSWEMDTCARGAFMENIVYALDPEGTRESLPEPGAGHGAHGAHGSHAHEDPTGLRADDLLFPCNAVDEMFWSPCYSMQTSVMLHFNGRDYRSTFALCASIPQPVQEDCFSSLGRDIGTHTEGDPAPSLQRCHIAPDASARQHCIRGLVAERMNGSGRIQEAFPLCELGLPEDKAGCFDAVGGMMRFMEPDQAKRESACMPVQEDLRAACMG